MHLREAKMSPHAQTPGVENPTTIMGNIKVAFVMKLIECIKVDIAMKHMRSLHDTTNVKSDLHDELTVMRNLLIAVRSMNHITMKSNQGMTTVIIKSMTTMVEEHIKSMINMVQENIENRFGMLVMRMKRLKIQGANAMRNITTDIANQEMPMVMIIQGAKQQPPGSSIQQCPRAK